MADLDLNELERLALKATPQQFDTAEVKRENGVMDCPICHGEGSVDTEADYCNYDGRAIGVEFYGIGKEFGAAERYYRAARPAIILAMIARIRELEQRAGVDAVEIMRICRLFLDEKEGDYDAKACFTAIFKIAAPAEHRFAENAITTVDAVLERGEQQ